MTEALSVAGPEVSHRGRSHPDGPGLTGVRKAAILLVLLGDDVASEVFRRLDIQEVQRLTSEISQLSSISSDMAAHVLQEYQRLSLTQDYLVQGGQEYATQLLVKAFGKEGANSLLAQVMQAQEANATSFDALRKADPEQLAKFVEGEHPQTVALLLAHLGARTSTSVLVLLPEKLRAEAVRRLAVMQQFSTEMVKRISAVLHKKLASVGEQSRRAYGGVSAVAEMLNNVDRKYSDQILSSIEQQDPKLSLAIRDLMFAFEDLSTVPEAAIREVLGQADKKTLATALKGASEDLKNHFYKSMSSRAVEMLKEDIEALGPVRSSQVRQAQQEIVNLARKLETDGKITLKSSGEDAYVV
ncbi:MAG: flagellar motor switch protein FliG [Terriglobia bacterium]|jgi:flagellar motor switch protein FliG